MQHTKKDPKKDQESGMVTVELAIGCAVIAIVLTALMSVIAVGLIRIDTCRSARDAAREASTGIPTTVKDAQITVEGSWVHAEVRKSASVPLLSAMEVACSVSTLREENFIW